MSFNFPPIDFSKVDYVTNAIALLSAAIGALLGAGAAYLLGRKQQREDRIEREHVAFLFAHNTVMARWNELKNIQANLLEKHRDNPKRHISIPHFIAGAASNRINFEEIAFLLKTDQMNLLHEIMMSEQAYDAVIASIAERNRRLEAIFQRPDGYKSFDAVTGKGSLNLTPHEEFFLREVTRELYECVDTSLPAFEKIIHRLSKFSIAFFKGKKAIGMTSKAPEGQESAFAPKASGAQ